MNLPLRRAMLPEIKLFRTRNLAALMYWITAVLALGLVVFWSTRLISPRPVAVLPTSIEAPRSASSERDIARIFGIQAGGVAANLDGITLTGVFSPYAGSGGFATFRTAKGGAGVTIGQEIVPGLRLKRLEPGRAVVSSDSGERTLELPKPKMAGLGQPSVEKPNPVAKAEPD